MDVLITEYSGGEAREETEQLSRDQFIGYDGGGGAVGICPIRNLKSLNDSDQS